MIFQQKKKIQERTILFNSSHCLLFVFAHNKNNDVKLGVSNCFYVLPHVGIKDGHYNYHHKPLPFIVCHKLKCPSLGHCSLIIKILGFVILFNTTVVLFRAKRCPSFTYLIKRPGTGTEKEVSRSYQGNIYILYWGSNVMKCWYFIILWQIWWDKKMTGSFMIMMRLF